MKKCTIIAMIAVAGLLFPTQADAQSLGGLLKKGKEVLGNVIGQQETTDSRQEQATDSNDTYIVNGIEVQNPILASMYVEPVGLYGVSRTETKGDAYLVLKVRNNERKESALFGSSINNKKMIAADNNGNVYNIDASGAMRYDTPEEMLVKIVMAEPQMMFLDVNKNLTSMPLVKIGISLDAQHQGNLTFKNVPVFWDQEPE